MLAVCDCLVAGGAVPCEAALGANAEVSEGGDATCGGAAAVEDDGMGAAGATIDWIVEVELPHPLSASAVAACGR